MGTSKQTIVIDVEVQTSLEGMNKVVSDLQEGIKKGATKLDLTKGIGASLSKSIAAFEKDYARIQKLTEGGSIQLGDTKEFTKKSQHLIGIFEDLQRVIGNFDGLQILDAKKLFPQAFDARIESLKASLLGLSDNFDKLATKGLNRDKLQREINVLESEIKSLKEEAEKEGELKLSNDKAQKALEEANQKIKDIRENLKQEFKLKIDTDLDSEEKLKEELKNLKKAQAERKSSKDIIDEKGRTTRYKGHTLSEWRKGPKDTTAQQRTGAIKVLQQYEKEKQQIKELEAALSQLQEKRKGMANTYAKMDTADLAQAATQLGKSTDEIDKITDALDAQKEASKDAAIAAENLSNAQTAAAKAGEKQAQLIEKQNKLKLVLQDIEQLSKKTDFSSLKKAFDDLNTALKEAGKDTIKLDFTEDTLKSEEGIKQLKAELERLDQQDLNKLIQALQQLGFKSQETEEDLKQVAAGVGKVDDEAKAINRTAQEMENLKNQVLDFFSITNTIQIFKNAVRDAFETVKELDAVMTETAVVTDFSVGDMWDKLPEYTEQANKLGASIRDLYAANTLYYQQGLNSQQAMSVGVETMKMARIANMDAAQATEAMTAALRGFNMEINETSATRINDVYSELAAITAADTSQIATAMSKTASIAASANMEFETTAALLAQIIETTQEAPETAGTAMKTIIARFTEVKQLYSEGMLTGKDSEGEEININKIDAALKKVGISLSDFLNGTKGIDDIFLELASKWDTLDLATQRYIATTAAGSRQQSRFLAMMSNYDRTMELVTAANNSAGASQKQFDKTTESLEAKLQKLKNAWAEFTMGLANNEVIKFGVDLLTKLLETVNKITGITGTDGFGGLVTMVLRLGTVLMGLKSGEGVINGLLKTLKNAGITELLGMKVGEDSKINLLSVLGKTGARTGNDIAGILEILKDPATRGDALKEVGSSFKALGVKIGGAAKAVLGFLKVWGGWIALAAVIVFSIIKIVKAFKAAQKETKLKGLQENLNQLDESAQEAKSTLESIGQDRKNLNRLNSDLENLTKGTMEWRQALIETNKEVLGLIEKYDFLADYVDYGADGQLIIKEEGWEALIAKQEQIISVIQGERIAVNAEKERLERDIDYENKIIEVFEEANAEFKASAYFDEPILNNGTTITHGDVLFAEQDTDALQFNQYQQALDQILDFLGWDSWEPMKVESPNQAIKRESGSWSQYTFEKYTGLDYEKLSDFAGLLYEKGITVDENGFSDREQAKRLLEALYGTEISFEKVEEVAIKLGTQFNDLGEIASKATLQFEKLNLQFFNNAVQSGPYKDLKWSDAGANIIYEGLYDGKDIDLIIEDEINKVRREYQFNRTKLMRDFATQQGYYFDGDKTIYTDSSMTTVVPATEEGMIRALATSNVINDINNKMGQIVNLLSKNPQAAEVFDQIFSQEGREISSSQLQKYYQNGQVDTTTLLKDLGFEGAFGTKEQADFLADLGLIDKLDENASQEEIKQAIEEGMSKLIDISTKNFELAKQRIKDERANTAYRMASRRNLGESSDEYATKTLGILENKFGESFRYTINEIMDSLEKSGDEQLLDAGYQLFEDIALVASPEEMDALTNFINGIDWSDPISAVNALNNEIEYGTGITQQYAEKLMQIDSSFFSASSQMQYYFNTDEFKEVQKELKEIIDLNGEITEADIKSLTGKYSKLNKMLKNIGLSASAVAKTFDLISKRKLKLNQLNEPVLALLKNFDSLGKVIDDALTFISEFDPGPDENEAAGFFKTGGETVLNNLNKGAYGNSQAWAYLDSLFPNWSEGLNNEQTIAMMKFLGEKMVANSENMFDMWSQLAKGETWRGEKIDEGILANGPKVEEQDGEIVITDLNGMNSEELAEWVSEAYGVSLQAAKLMVTDLKNYSIDAKRELLAADFDSGMAAAYDELGTVSGFDPTEGAHFTKKTVDESTISALMAIGNKTREEILSYWGGEDNLIITNFRNANGELKETGEILGQISKLSGSTFDRLDKEFSTGGVFNLTGFSNRLGEWGFNEAEQRKIIEDTIAQRVSENDGKGIEIEVVMPDGTIEKLTDVTSYADYEVKYNQKIEDDKTERYASQVGEVIGKAIANAITAAIANALIAIRPEEFMKVNFTGDDGAVVPVVASKTSLEQMGYDVQEGLDGNPATVKITGNFDAVYAAASQVGLVIEAQIVPAEGTGTNTASGSSSTGGTTGGGGEKPRLLPERYLTWATGIKNSPISDDVLVSEEGPELIQKAHGGAYLTGLQGPEIAQIERGDTVYTAEETKQIFKKRRHSIMPRFAGGGGIHAYGGVTSKASGGSSPGKEEEDKWENPFDKLYNLVRKIDEELRQRERIERRYEKLLENLNVSANKIIKVSREELVQLERERMLQERLVSGRKDQISKYQSENADLTKYANVVQNDRGEDVLRINWDLINSVTDSDQGQRIEEYVSQLEEWFESLEEAEDALWEIEDAVAEIKERGKEEYFELEDAIKEALAQNYQDEIDKLNEINNSINDTNSQLLDSIQKTLDKQRQDRENERTEEELSEKQRRLLYLQQDTSGANAMEILKLQEEIAEGQEDYTDTLIDQKISELQDQNEQAAKQREQQITIAQAQLDHYIETGRIWQEVYGLMDEGLDHENGLVRGSRLEAILKSTDGFRGMSEIGKMEWLNDTNNMIAQALAYLEIGRQLEDIGMQAGSQIEFTTSDGRVLTGTVDDKGNVTTADGQVFNNVFQGADGKYYAGENIADVEEPIVESPSGGQDNSGATQQKNNPYGTASNQGNYYYAKNGKTIWGGNGVKAIQWALNDMGYDAGTIDGGYGYATAQAVSRFQRAEGIQADGDYGPQTREKMKLRGYKTGGLADFTGPAWLDGTKARPELVLNAKDTQNFIQLKDILASLMTGSNTSTENNGDITYDIDINVESIGSDYDVEQVANKVKSLISDDARYRNNNTVSLKR